MLESTQLAMDDLYKQIASVQVTHEQNEMQKVRSDSLSVLDVTAAVIIWFGSAVSAVYSSVVNIYSIVILAMSPQNLVSGGSIDTLKSVQNVFMWISVVFTSLIFSALLLLAFSAVSFAEWIRGVWFVVAPEVFFRTLPMVFTNYYISGLA
eukprot:403367610